MLVIKNTNENCKKNKKINNCMRSQLPLEKILENNPSYGFSKIENISSTLYNFCQPIFNITWDLAWY